MATITDPPLADDPTWPVDAPRPPTDLPDSDGVPLESLWHARSIPLLVESLDWHFRDRDDYFVGGNMFVYFSSQQVRDRDYRGPAVFFVRGVPRHGRERRYWAIWDEGGRYPDVIIELTSPTTAREDRTTKKQLYEEVFRTREYFLYDPDGPSITAWRLADHNGERFRYEPIRPDPHGHYWSDVLGLALGSWEGLYGREPAIWPRFFHADGHLVLIEAETTRQLAEEATRQAADQRQRAEAAETELERLRKLLAQQGSTSDIPTQEPPQGPDRRRKRR